MKFKIIILTFIAILFGIKLNAQNTDIKNRWNLKANYYTNGEKDPYKTSFVALEGNYGILNLVELGCYFDYGLLGKDILYGGNLNFHILPIFIESKKLRFDVYTSGKLGVLNSKPPDTYGSNGLVESDWERELTWGCYLGSAYYLTNHFGFFIESGYEHSVNVGFKTHVGLTIKF